MISVDWWYDYGVVWSDNGNMTSLVVVQLVVVQLVVVQLVVVVVVVV